MHFGEPRVDASGGDDVFANLAQTKVGDSIVVDTAGGNQVTFTVKSGLGTSSCTNNSRNDGTAIIARIMTGTMVHRISIGVLWVVRDGAGLARALKRTMQMRRSASTKAEIAAMTQSRKK